MDFKLGAILSMSILLLLTSCHRQAKNAAIDSTVLMEQVKTQVNAFHAADTSMNAQGVIDLLWPEFTILVDGNRIAYEDVKTGTKAFMASLESFHTEWVDLKIVPLGNHHAIASFIFTDSIVGKDGTITQARGPNTFVWEKRNEEWKLIYCDADHYPVE